MTEARMEGNLPLQASLDSTWDAVAVGRDPKTEPKESSTFGD